MSGGLGGSGRAVAGTRSDLVGKPSRLAFPALKRGARALKELQIECVNSTHLTNSDLSPLQGESPYLMVPRVETLG
jgi:hypothetical protein